MKKIQMLVISTGIVLTACASESIPLQLDEASETSSALSSSFSLEPLQFEELKISELGMSLRYPALVSYVYQGSGLVVFNAPAVPAFVGDNVDRGPIFLEIYYESIFDPAKKAAIKKGDYEGVYYGGMEKVLQEEQDVLLHRKSFSESQSPCLTPPAAADRQAAYCEISNVGGKRALKFYYNHSVSDRGYLGIGYVLYTDTYRIHISLSPTGTPLAALDAKTGVVIGEMDDQLRWGKLIVDSIELK